MVQFEKGVEWVRDYLLRLSPFYKYHYSPGDNFFQYDASRTTLEINTLGVGDSMMVHQLGKAFVEYVTRRGDPGLGDLVLTSGGYAPKLRGIREGDVNLYWWYSFGPYDDSPELFIDEHLEPNLPVRPDLVLCGSERIQREAKQAGYETLYFPIGQYGFRPLDIERTGLGYAGTRWHKAGEKVRMMLGPFKDEPDFDWVSEYTLPEQMNLWYNTRTCNFGITKEGQREWGVVNSRVFESLASGTPLVIRHHPSIEDVLGFEYPYQVTSRAEVVETVEEIRTDLDAVLERFEEYSERVRNEHSYLARLDTLFERLQ